MINWWTMSTVPIWLASAIQEFINGNVRLGVISLCFALANGCLSTLGGK